MARKEFKDSIWKMINIGYVGLFQLFSFYLLTKLLEPEQYGLFVLLMASLSFLQIFSEFGVPASSSKYLTESLYSDTQPRDVVKAGEFLSLVAGLGISLVCFLFAREIGIMLKNPYLEPLLKTGSILLLINNFNRLMEELFKGMHEFRIPAFLNLVFKPIQLGLMIFLVLSGFQVMGALVSVILGSLLVTVFGYGFFQLKYYTRWKPGKEFRAWIKKILIYSLPIGIAGFSYYFYTKIDILLLSYFHNTGEIAVYNVADMIYQIPLTFCLVLGSVISPIVTREYTLKNHKKIQDLFTGLQSLTFFILLPVSIALFLLSGTIIHNFFPHYTRSILLLKILSPLIILKGVGQITTVGFIISTGKAKILAWCTAIGAMLNSLFDLIFIPKYGALGAILTTSVIHGIIIIYTMSWLLKKLNLKLVIGIPEALALLRRAIFEKTNESINEQKEKRGGHH